MKSCYMKRAHYYLIYTIQYCMLAAKRSPILFRSIYAQLRYALFQCYLCRLPADTDQLICRRCQTYFEENDTACHRCAMPMTTSSDTLCGQCQQASGYIDKTFAPWRYQQPLTRLIHDFKYFNALCLAPFLAQCILDKLPLSLPEIDYLVPMPIHQKRLKYRGYNQTSLLSKVLSKHTGIPLNQSLCHRIIFQAPQALLDQKDRLKNTKGAFIAKPVEQLHIVIIDDLITTGATANSLAKELKQHGARQIDLWCVARQY